MKKILIVGNYNISSLITDKETIASLMQKSNMVTIEYKRPKIESINEYPEPLLIKESKKDVNKQFYKFIAK